MFKIIQPVRSAALSLVIIYGTIASAAAQNTIVKQAENFQFWQQWVSLWNGDYALAKDIIAPEFHLHATLLDGRAPSEINTPQEFGEWASLLRGAFPDLTFKTQVGPIVQQMESGDFEFAGHWEATGTYAGGFTNATVPVGSKITFAGTDVFRVKDGKITDYWLATDTVALFNQLGIELSLF